MTVEPRTALWSDPAPTTPEGKHLWRLFAVGKLDPTQPLGMRDFGQRVTQIESEARAAALRDVAPILEVTHEEDDSWSVAITALPGHIGAAMTVEDAAHEAKDAAEAWLEAQVADERAAALREVAEPLIDLFDRATMPGDDSTPLYDYLGDDARATVDKARAILTEATGASADEQAGPWKCRVCGGLGAHTVEGVEDIPDHRFRPPEATDTSATRAVGAAE